MIKDNETAHSMTKDAMLLVFIAIIGLALLTSCATKSKFNRIADKHEDWLSERCSEQFPVKDSVVEGKTDTVTTSTIRTDTVYVTRVNTVTGKTEIVKLPCPPCKETVRTIVKSDTMYRRDTAKERVWELKYLKEHDNANKLEEQLTETKKERNWAVGILAGLVLIALGLKFFKVV